jgi:hypothetical protein
LIRSRIGVTAAVSVGFAALLGCSKTQDTSPETRVFGDPPVIQAVAAEPETRQASCDVAKNFTSSRQWCRDGPNYIGGLNLVVTYTDARISASVSDPDSTPDETEILLVAASYLTESGSSTLENSIVMFDDGGQVPFDFGQKSGSLGGLGDTCGFDAGQQLCVCNQAVFEVNSNDEAAADGTYVRRFAFPSVDGIPGSFDAGLLPDCIAKSNQQASQPTATVGATREFRIEAVDRGGNLSESGIRPSITIGPTTISCQGDPCACCLLTNPDPRALQGGCRDLDGLTFTAGGGGTAAVTCPNGACKPSRRGDYICIN